VRSLAATPLALAALLACTVDVPVGVAPSRGRQFVAVVPEAGRSQVDLLVVIDDSGSMELEQQTLARAIQGELLAAFAELPSLHIGVTSTNMGGDADLLCTGQGDDGRLLVQSSIEGCEGLSVPGGFLSDIPLMDGTRLRNFDRELADALGCLVQLGTAGCGFEQPFAAAIRATDPSVNPDFVRPGALLAVLFVTDEDDCSALSPDLFADRQGCTDYSEPDRCPLGPLRSFRCFEQSVSCAEDVRSPGVKTGCEVDQDSDMLFSPREVARALRGRKTREHDVLVGVIAAPTRPVAVAATSTGELSLTPSCTAEDGISGAPALRLEALVEEFPAQSSSSSVCELGTGTALERFGSLLRDTVEGRPCVRGALADSDPRAGLQPSCAAFDVIGYASSDARFTPIPSCSSSDEPCFELVADEQCAHTETGLAANVRRSSPSSSETTLVVECQLDGR